MKQVDEQVTELLTATRPELSARWQERVLEKARRPAVRHRGRWVAVAVGVAVVLAGLGLIPLRPGNAKGLLNQAMAAMVAANSVHFVGYGTAPDESRPTGMRMMPDQFEFWVSDHGIALRTLSQDGSLVASSGINLDTNEDWDYAADTGVRYVADLAPVRGQAAQIVSKASRALLSGSLAQVLGSALTDIKESVHTENRDGREVHVLTYTGALTTKPTVHERFVFELDTETSRLVAFRQYAQADTSPEELVGLSTLIEYDLPVPTNLAPEGVKDVPATVWVEETDRLISLVMKVNGKEITRTDLPRN